MYKMGTLFKVGSKYIVNIYKADLFEPVKLLKTFEAYSKPTLISKIYSFCRDLNIKEKDWSEEIYNE